MAASSGFCLLGRVLHVNVNMNACVSLRTASLGGAALLDVTPSRAVTIIVSYTAASSPYSLNPFKIGFILIF